MSGSGISWAICKSAPRSRQITTPAPHHSVFYRPDALPATQPTVSKHWRLKQHYKYSSRKHHTVYNHLTMLWNNTDKIGFGMTINMNSNTVIFFTGTATDVIHVNRDIKDDLYFSKKAKQIMCIIKLHAASILIYRRQWQWMIKTINPVAVQFQHNNQLTGIKTSSIMD